ncbi:MAG TPA: class I SAM-dependent methyltransferase [Mycobacteriales bacterium]|nr:class I SAM-dependent methyltransferase [Mycobacteriales bacterium]
MSLGGTQAHLTCPDLPPLVRTAAEAAAAAGFGESCLPEQGRLLALLAAGVGHGRIGETGTGCGVGLAWLTAGATPGAHLVSIDHDGQRAAAARAVFDGRPADGPPVRILSGDWAELSAYGPFDLLVLDGGGQGKGDRPPIEVADWLRPGGLVVLDDFTPFTTWPPVYEGRPDAPRLHWLRHERLLSCEIPLRPGAATIVGRYLGVPS